MIFLPEPSSWAPRVSRLRMPTMVLSSAYIVSDLGEWTQLYRRYHGRGTLVGDHGFRSRRSVPALQPISNRQFSRFLFGRFNLQ
jgi:hypothetical protein